MDALGELKKCQCAEASPWMFIGKKSPLAERGAEARQNSIIIWEGATEAVNPQQIRKHSPKVHINNNEKGKSSIEFLSFFYKSTRLGSWGTHSPSPLFGRPWYVHTLTFGVVHRSELDSDVAQSFRDAL